MHKSTNEYAAIEVRLPAFLHDCNEHPERREFLQRVLSSSPKAAPDGAINTAERLQELLEHVLHLRLILPVISVSVMALRRQDAESDTDIACVLSEQVCEPLDGEIERIESMLVTLDEARLLIEQVD
jgi:hypothetical protein